MAPEKKEQHGSFMYRCTREAPYIGKNVPGAMDTSARQGYYIRANSAGEAYREMCDRFPDEADVGFTVAPWKEC